MIEETMMVKETEGILGEGGWMVVDIQEGEEGRRREITRRGENLMSSVNLC